MEQKQHSEEYLRILAQMEAAYRAKDVKALLRIAQVYDIPIANNKATADFMITSKYMDEEYEHNIINFHQNIAERARTL